jgi:hypothetical protein
MEVIINLITGLLHQVRIHILNTSWSIKYKEISTSFILWRKGERLTTLG